MKVNEQQRSMIATEFVRGFQRGHRGLCCSETKLVECARIVGKRHAELLATFFYEELACGGFKDAVYHAEQEQYFLDKIADLDELR